MTTRQQVNETAANVAKLLTLITRMPDAQIDYLFDDELICRMHAASQDIIEKGEDMINIVDDWYLGCGEPSEGRESELGRLHREANEN